MNKSFQRLLLVLGLASLLANACAPAPVSRTSPGPTSPLTTSGSTDPVPEGSGPTPGSVDAPDPARGRDAALAYLGQYHGLELPRNPAWDEEVVTPEKLVGAHAVKYRSSGWDGTVQVSMPVVAPQHVVYTVWVDDPATGFHWEGKVDARGNVTETSPPAGEPVPQVPANDLQELLAGNSAFAFDLYQALRWQEGNLFFSPYSITVALAMTYAGARGETETEMAHTLHFGLPQERLHPAFNGLARELAERGEGAREKSAPPGEPGDGFQLNVASALWGQTGYAFIPDFRDVLARDYGAGMRLVDFVTDAERARSTINDWVSEQTEGRIENLIPAGVLDATTRLVLTNAIYFNAAWAKPFQESATADSPFYLVNGETVAVPLMHQSDLLRYGQGEGYQLVELPYRGHEFSMVLLLPDRGTFDVFEGELDLGEVEAMLAEMAPRDVDLTMPRFKFEAEFSLNKVLEDLGMPLAFTDEADFSGMTGQRDLFISDVLHKAFVAVDEEGTEAAAATAVVMSLAAAMAAEPVEVRADRPFVFLIRDIETGTILFLGRVVDPSE